ncbi:MAG: hypothetical protein ACU0B1_10120 [Thermohalobaculum sp.]
MATFLSDYFDVEQERFDEYGAFNISIINDLPLFIDPFLLFHSEKQEYVELHDQIICYLIFLRDKSKAGATNTDLLKSWYCFPEVKQNWLGFSVSGNSGRGLGLDFAGALHKNLHRLFPNFGEEEITQGSHLEKVCLIASGVGRDNISDFTTNLIKDFLCRFTEAFALKHLTRDDVRDVTINNARFNFRTESWERRKYKLPWVNGDYIILTPKDMLTRDENWINKGDLIHGFEQIPTAIPDAELRAQVSNYFNIVLAKHKDREANATERAEAAVKTMLTFPQIIDYYIKLKEATGDRATDISAKKVLATEYLFVHQLQEIQRILLEATVFYNVGKTTYEEAHSRLDYLKDVIENKGGHRLFYQDGIPIKREIDLQILFRLVWFGTPSDAGTEANDGRGPVDFKISRGAKDKTLIEMKLAKNSHLERNLEKQVPIYQAASDAKHGIKAIIFFSQQEEDRVVGILDKLGLLGHKDIVLIDARNDNKPSGSKA